MDIEPGDMETGCTSPRENGKDYPCEEEESELSVLLDGMRDELGSLAEDSIALQSSLGTLLKEVDASLCEDIASRIQGLDRHSQYLMELSRLSGGLSRSVAGSAISVPALCRLVRLPSLRARFLGKRDEQEAGEVSLF